MNDIVQVIVAIGGLAAFVTALGSLIVGVQNSRKANDAKIAAATAAAQAEAAKQNAEQVAEAAKRELVEIGGGLFEVGKRIDGRLSELLDAEKRAARAEGRVDGITEEQARTAKVLANLAAGKPVPAADALMDLHGEPAPPIDVHVVQHDSEPPVRVKAEKPK